MTEAFKRGYALRKGRVSLANQAYSVTMVTAHRENFFTNFHMGRIVVDHLRKAGDSCLTIAFVVMPDHLHWLFMLGERYSLSHTINMLKSSSARRCGMPIWQKGYHDHALRQEESIKDVARYIVANPLRAKLVSRLADYPYWNATWL